MPRNGAGLYSLPVSPFVGNTVISPTDVNSDFSDIATAITQSIATTGVSQPSAPISFFAGTVSAPGITFLSHLTMGVYTDGAYMYLCNNGYAPLRINNDGTVLFAGNWTSQGTAGFANIITCSASAIFQKDIYVSGSASFVNITTSAATFTSIAVNGPIVASNCTFSAATITGAFTVQGSAAFNGQINSTSAASFASASATSLTATSAYMISASATTLNASAATFTTLNMDGAATFNAAIVVGDAVSVNTSGVSFNQSRFQYTGATTVALVPYNGNVLFINGKMRVIPASGVTLTNGGLGANTFYYVYAYMSGSTMTLEASTTGYTTDTNYGIPIKSGDGTRSLVGAVRTNGSSQFVDTEGYRGVIRWFNRRQITSWTTFSTTRTTASGSQTEVDSETRNYFIAWSDYTPYASLHVNCTVNVAADNAAVGAGIGLDSTSSSTCGGTTTNNNTNSPMSITVQAPIKGITENDIHFVTILGTTTAGTVSFPGNGNITSFSVSSLIVYLMG